jgi:hypothetical protein
MQCARFRGNGTCAAFREGIPEEIWSGEHNHEYEFPGDKGLTFVQANYDKTDEKYAFPDGPE